VHPRRDEDNPGLLPAARVDDDDQAEAEAQDAQLQAGPQEQLALLFWRPDGIVALPHVHGLHSQCSPQPHVVCSRCPPAPLPDVHLQSLPPGHGTAHPHLSSHPMRLMMPAACGRVAAPAAGLRRSAFRSSPSAARECVEEQKEVAVRKQKGSTCFYI